MRVQGVATEMIIFFIYNNGSSLVPVGQMLSPYWSVRTNTRPTLAQNSPPAGGHLGISTRGAHMKFTTGLEK